MDLSIAQMMTMQQDLYARHAGQWSPPEPEYGKEFMLYLVEELGETIGILKKKGAKAIVDDPLTRQAFLEEMADVLMYYHEILIRFHVSPEEISAAYIKKHNRNMGRDYSGEYAKLYTGGDNIHG